jgi:glycosyltransferase involved in cell wall biosynthesis
MKICFLADIRSIHTQRWISFFAQRYDTFLVSIDYPEDLHRVEEAKKYFSQNGVTVYTISKSIPNIIFSPFIVKKILNKIHPDLIHAHFVTQYGFLGAFSNHHPFILTAWGTDVLIDPKKSLLLRTIIKFAIRKADIITCDGENTKNALVGLGARISKIKHIYFGVDTNKFNPIKADRDLFTSKFGFHNVKVVIYLRGFEPVYDAETIIKAIPKIVENIPQVKFLLAGSGSQMENLQERVRGFEFKDSIFFLGRIPNDELPSYLASSDVYISTSLSDSGIAASTAEAMASGVAVISTDCGDIKLWINDKYNGYIIEKENPDMLADRVIRLLKNDEQRKQFGARGREKIELTQDYHKEMKKMDEIYRQLIGEQS